MGRVPVGLSDARPASTSGGPAARESALTWTRSSAPTQGAFQTACRHGPAKLAVVRWITNVLPGPVTELTVTQARPTNTKRQSRRAVLSNDLLRYAGALCMSFRLMKLPMRPAWRGMALPG